MRARAVGCRTDPELSDYAALYSTYASGTCAKPVRL